MTLKRNTLLNIIGAGLPMIVGVLAIPFLITGLGVERFGILTILWVIIGYFSLFDFGVGRATTQQVATYLGAGRHDEIQEVIGTGVRLSLFAGLGAMLILALISYALAYNVLNISLELKEECLYALLIVAIGIPFATVSSALRGAIEAYEKFRESNIVRVIFGTSIFLFPAIGLSIHGASLPAVSVWLVMARVLGLFLYWRSARQLPHYNGSGHRRLDSAVRKKLFSFGAWMTTSNLVSPILVNADRVLISNLMGASMVAYYTVPFEVLARLLIVPGAIGTTMLPRFSSGFLDNGRATHNVFARSVRVTAIIMAVLCAVAAVVSYPMMHYLISDDFARKSWPVVLILTFGVLINGVAYLPYTALHAYGAVKPVAILHVAELVIYLPFVILFISYLGLIGAAIAWTLRASLDCIGLFLLYNKYCQQPQGAPAACSIQG